MPEAIYLARGNWHMEIHPSPNSKTRFLRLNQNSPENHCRPSVDALFRSAAATYGATTLGVILTGMGSDGLAGCRALRECGGTVIAQDQASSAVWGMPGSVVHANLAHRVLPLNAIAQEILRLTSRSQREAAELRESAM
jgi:two-component system chemotaxis response regulator CheB